ncbi:MAG: amidohydrolase [Bacteroidetes bacterium]|nr:MAG: amidohydrolase [Bacteroidota bacterium]
MKKIIFSCLISTLFLSACIKTEKADLVVHNAKIYLLNTTFETAEAMAIKDGKILETGPERQILNKYSAQKVYDAGKMVVYPGLIDAHCHLWNYAKSLNEIDLSHTNSEEEIYDLIQKYIEENPDREWITGRGWDQNKWNPPTFPDNHILDSLFPGKKIVLTRIDGHAVWCSSNVLKLANINSGTQVKGGQILMKNGKPTGILIDNAMDKVTSLIPPLSDDEKKKLILKAQEKLFEQGITSIADAGTEEDILQLLKEMNSEGTLKIKVYSMIWISDSSQIDKHISQMPYRDKNLHIRSFKLMADGALGSRGACLLAPYSDSLNHYGTLIHSPVYIEKIARKIYNAGLQLNIHCIGDSANRVVLNVYGKILKQTNDFRWRIEHAQIVNEKDISKFRDFTVIPSVQPTHAISDKNWAATRLGERIKDAYRYQTLLNQNKIIALGTDFPVEDISPLKTFYAAVYRKNYDGSGQVFLPEEALSKKEALMGMTIWNAIADFEENEKGSLEPGKSADFIVLDTDLMECEAEQVLKAHVIQTFVNGKSVFKRNQE